jgi:hypothetical protein
MSFPAIGALTRMSEYAVQVRPRARKAVPPLDPAARKDIQAAMRTLGTDPRQ